MIFMRTVCTTTSKLHKVLPRSKELDKDGLSGSHLIVVVGGKFHSIGSGGHKGDGSKGKGRKLHGGVLIRLNY